MSTVLTVYETKSTTQLGSTILDGNCSFPIGVRADLYYIVISRFDQTKSIFN